MNFSEVIRSMTNIKPNDEQIKRIEDVRDTYHDCVLCLQSTCNTSRELSIAITKLEESLMWAIKSIVLEDK